MNTDRIDPATELEPLHVVLPIRTVSGGKARLGQALDAEEREELVLGLLLHTLAVLETWPVERRIHIVSPDPLVAVTAGRTGAVGRSGFVAQEGAEARQGTVATVHRQPDEGLNAGVALGIGVALAQGASSLLVLPGDLPDLSVDALDELLLAADAGVVAAGGGALVTIAPSDAGGGTNALLLRPPDVIAPAFGPASFEAHLRAAEAAGAAVQVVDHPQLGFDLDTPDDLERLDTTRLRELMALGRAALEGVGV
jgi:2-phospho-L-lactate guanylyltransferase